MASLALLPAELLHDIFVYLLDPAYGDITDSYRAFAGLASSCRALNRISTQYLYSRYESSIEQPIAGFLRKILNSDDLRPSLKHISILGGTQPVYHQTVQRRLRRELKADVAKLPEPYRSTWSHLAHGNLAIRNDIELAILFLQASNVESLAIAKDAGRAVRMFDDLSQPPPYLLPLTNAGQTYSAHHRPPTTTLPYQHLHSLTLNLQSSRPSSLVHLFALPALQSLHFRNLLDHAYLKWLRDGGGWEDLNTYPHPDPWLSSCIPHPSLTSLVLEDIHIPMSDITWMINACEHLHTFDIVGGSDTMSYHVPSESRRWCIDILRCLMVHRETLEYLRVDPHLCYPHHADGHDEWESINGFMHFPHLKSLDTTFSNLVGHPPARLDANGALQFADNSSAQNWWTPFCDAVPASIERLRVRFDGILECECDALFLVLLHGELPNLKSVEAYYHYGNVFLFSRKTHPIDFWDVQRSFRNHGRIDFIYKIGFELWGSGALHRELLGVRVHFSFIQSAKC